MDTDADSVDIPTLNLIDLDKLAALITVLAAGKVMKATIGEIELIFTPPPGPLAGNLVGFSAEGSAEEDEDDFDGYRKALGGRLPSFRRSE